MNRQEVLMQIDSIVDSHCKGCNRLEGIPIAQRNTFCKENCIFGAQLNELGDALNELSNKRKQRHIRPLLNKGDQMTFQDMQALLETDITREDLVKATGLTRNEIGDFLIANDYQKLEAEEDLEPVNKRRSGRRSLQIPLEQYIALKVAGFTYEQIGEKLGFKGKQVGHWARVHKGAINARLNKLKGKIG